MPRHDVLRVMLCCWVGSGGGCDSSAPPSEDTAVVAPDAQRGHDAQVAIDAGPSICTEGEEGRCYTGPGSTRGLGVCVDGRARCEAGVWGDCEGEVVPATDETCGDARDEDCDGRTDEGCGACTPDERRDCYSGPAGTEGIGVCRSGTQRCGAERRWDPSCVGVVLPAAEACDGVDDDCDGSIDELGTEACGVGACARVVDRCRAGSEQVCVAGEQTPESCNGADDDCDGRTDEAIEPRGCGVGACVRVAVCVAGASTECTPGAPIAEACNGVDDDCDGRTDESDPGGGSRCPTERPGICGMGTTVCESGVLVCRETVEPREETCNRFDDDCDGSVDENGAAERCNGRDDDCDGRTDEGNPEGGGRCSTGMRGICNAGLLRCGGSVLRCVAEELPRTETCNGLDDDCDGEVDEHRGPERCNGRDDDCDGAVDERPIDGTTLRADCDRDGFAGVGSESTTWCSGTTLPMPSCASGVFVETAFADDCNDRDARAYPGQSDHFAAPMTTETSMGLRWDFDCDGVETLRSVGRAPSCGPLATCRSLGGWEAETPSCGESASWAQCTLTSDGTRCGQTRSSRAQACR